MTMVRRQTPFGMGPDWIGLSTDTFPQGHPNEILLTTDNNTFYVSNGVGWLVCPTSGTPVITAADGAIVTLGSDADAAVGDASGTLNAHARQIAKIVATAALQTSVGSTNHTDLVNLLTQTVLAAGTNLIGKVGVDQTTPGTTNRVQAGKTFAFTVKKTRPADTNAYAVNDAIAESASAGTVWTFPLTGLIGATITAAYLASSDTAGVPQIEVDLYQTAPTAINDNAEATELDANFETNIFLGTLTFPSLAKKSASSTVSVARLTGLTLPVVAVGAQIYGIVRTMTVFTPVSAATYTIGLAGIAD